MCIMSCVMCIIVILLNVCVHYRSFRCNRADSQVITFPTERSCYHAAHRCRCCHSPSAIGDAVLERWVPPCLLPFYPTVVDITPTWLFAGGRPHLAIPVLPCTVIAIADYWLDLPLPRGAPRSPLLPTDLPVTQSHSLRYQLIVILQFRFQIPLPTLLLPHCCCSVDLNLVLFVCCGVVVLWWSEFSFPTHFCCCCCCCCWIVYVLFFCYLYCCCCC